MRIFWNTYERVDRVEINYNKTYIIPQNSIIRINNYENYIITPSHHEIVLLDYAYFEYYTRISYYLCSL